MGRHRTWASVSVSKKDARTKRRGPCTIVQLFDAPPSIAQQLEPLRGLPLVKLARQRNLWKAALAIADEQHITISRETRSFIEAAFARADRECTPIYPIARSQRLAYLMDETDVRCVLEDRRAGYLADQRYPLDCHVIDSRAWEDRPERTQAGTYEMARVTRVARRLHVETGTRERKQHFLWEEYTVEDDWLHQHVSIHDPGDIATRERPRYDRAVEVLRQMERELPVELRDFQREDVARLLVKRSGLLAAEMGSGKTIMSLAFAWASARLGARDQCLFIVPQDLVPQWRREARRFFQRELRVIADVRAVLAARDDQRAGRTHGEPPVTAREAADLLARGHRGWWITWYEVLARNGRVLEELPDDHPINRRLTAKDACPGCGERDPSQWNGTACRACDWFRRRLMVKPGYAQLTTAFRRGTIVVDEGTIIKGADSLVSLAVRGLRASRRIVLTGTPVKNVLGDAFHLLAWAAGPNSFRFPYGHGDRDEFVRDFCVTEKVRFKGAPVPRTRLLPDVTNVYCLWRLLAPIVLRRRLDQAGVQLVPCRYVPVTVPFGRRQRDQYTAWLDPENFVRFFLRAYPSGTVTDPKIIRRHAAVLGQLWRLEYAATAPAAERHRDYDPPGGPTNWTPKNLQVLELVRRHVAAGEKVLVGSDLIATGVWLSEQLDAQGIESIHIAEETAGRLVTIGPKRRSAQVADFISGTASVLCCGIQAMNLGHNLDCASTVILTGLPWDLATLQQFVARVRRLTSRRPITVYVVMVEGSIDQRKWELLQAKLAASHVAIDGHTVPRDEDPVDLQGVLEDMQRMGVGSGSGDLDEAECEAAWRQGRALFGDGARTRIVLPDPGARYRLIFELAGALSSGYDVHLPDGRSRLTLDAEGLFCFESGGQTVRVDGQPVRGTAFDVAERVVGWWVALELTDLEVEPGRTAQVTTMARWRGGLCQPGDLRAGLRLARMPADDRVRTLSWWRYGDYHWRVRADEAGAGWVGEWRWTSTSTDEQGA
jgi:hypothetical protein